MCVYAYVPRLVSVFSNLRPNWPPECTGSGRGPPSPAGSGPTGRGLGKPRARGVGPRNLQTSQREGRSQHATTGESLLRSDAGPAFVGVCDLPAGPRGCQVSLLRARPRMSPIFSPCSAWPAPGWAVKIAPPPGKWGTVRQAGGSCARAEVCLSSRPPQAELCGEPGGPGLSGPSSLYLPMLSSVSLTGKTIPSVSLQSLL